MLERFKDHLLSSQLIPVGARVLLGYSGGADSTCLLHLLAACQVDVVAAHLHHGQRPEADEELARCQAFAEQLDVPFASGRADVPAIGQSLKIGFEEAGRNARYSFFDQAAHQTECSLIATAHTLTDHSETVIFHLARGSGLAGLAGISARRDNIVRPLLGFSRDETRQYCIDHQLWFHDDPANGDVNFSRARIRHRILPEIRAINPMADLAIARLAKIVAEEDQFLNGMAAAALEQADLPLNGPLRFLTHDIEICLDQTRLLSLPAVLLKRAVRVLTQALGGDLTYEQTQALCSGLVAQPKGSVTAEGGTVVLDWDGTVLNAIAAQVAESFRFPITNPGETIADDLGWKIVAYESGANSKAISRTDLTQQFDLSLIKGSLYFRSAKLGEKIQPTGFKGHRLISDLLSEARLTLLARHRIPIICDMVGPIWIPGVCTDDRVRKISERETVLTIRFEAIS